MTYSRPGIVLYEIFTCRTPFYADSPLETARAIVSSSPAPPLRFVPELPHRVESLILKMLAKDPAMRPSAMNAAQQLEVISPDKAPRRISQRLAIGGVLVIAAVAAAFSFWLRPQPATEKLDEFKQFTYLSPENRPHRCRSLPRWIDSCLRGRGRARSICAPRMEQRTES